MALVYSHPHLRGKRQFTFATSPRCASARQPRFSVLVTRHNKHGMVSLEDVLLVLASTARCNARDAGVLGRMCHALRAAARREDVWQQPMLTRTSGASVLYVQATRTSLLRCVRA